MGLIRWVFRIVWYGIFGVVAFVAMFANHHTVLLKFDPFNPDTGFLAPIELRLTVIILGALLVGFVTGGMVMWFLQGRHRRRARQMDAEANAANRQLRAFKLKENRADRDDGTGLPALPA